MALVDEIYDALTDDDAMTELPGRLAAYAGARSCVIQSFAKDQSILLMAQNGYFHEQMAQFYVAAQMYRHDPWRQICETSRFLGAPCLSTDLIDVEEYRRSAFYNEYYRRFGDDTAFSVGGAVAHRRGVVSMGMQRGIKQAPFTQSDIALVHPLIPHLIRLVEVRSALAHSTMLARSAQQLLDGLPQAVLVLDGAGRLEYANRRGETLLRRGGPLNLRAGVVHIVEARQDARFGGLVASASRGMDSHGGAMLVEGETATFRMVVAPWRAGERTRVVVLADNPADRDSRLETKLTGLFGLTAMEAATITALADGQTPSEVAERRGVSIATVRTQIQRAIDKSEARALSDLLRRVASLPRISLDAAPTGPPPQLFSPLLRNKGKQRQQM